MVPVLDEAGRSVPLPTSPENSYGYDLEFDAEGRCGDLRIDFPALAAHLLQLDIAARRLGIGLRKVIFDPALQPLLHGTPAWNSLEDRVAFSRSRARVRQDEHYHVEFAVECGPFAPGLPAD